MANILLVVPCCPSDGNPGQKKPNTISVQHTQRNQSHCGHFASMNVTSLNYLKKEMLYNNTQLELLRK